MTPANCPRCGGRLARDNHSGRCAHCQAAERDRLTAPPAVPPPFWDHQPVRAALARRHLGHLIRAYRHHPYHGRLPLTQSVVAGWLGITQAQLSRIENGPAPIHLDRLTHWATLLRIPEKLLWFRLLRKGADPAPVGWASSAPHSPDEKPGTLDASPYGEVVTTNRRQFTTLAALVGLGSSDQLDLLTRSVDATPAIGMDHVRLARSVVDDFRRADAVIGANGLREVAIHVHARLSELAAKARYSRDVGEALQSALADLAIETAWLAIDSEHRATARPYLNEAITRARIADDPHVEVRALTQLSLLLRPVQPIESLHCAEAALRNSAGWATPRLRTLLHLRRAHTLAELGDASAHERAMAKARHELERGPHEDDEGFVHFVNEQEVQGIRGLSYLDLDKPDRAAEAFRSVAEHPSPQHRRNQVYYAVHLTEATRRQGDINEAARMALDVLPAVRRLNSQRVTKHLGQIRSDLGRLRQPTAPVREFTQAYDERIAP
ncbi:helix-turn-helix domain-containing protein [Micromonospora sp. NPDC048871]|uniref:helix-turn-helix domain-containing protein n=1 Tax=Micromonospora sp. NPDC048871 TaxID=3364259 RepID=UPI00371BA9AF